MYMLRLMYRPVDNNVLLSNENKESAFGNIFLYLYVYIHFVLPKINLGLHSLGFQSNAIQMCFFFCYLTSRFNFSIDEYINVFTRFSKNFIILFVHKH